MPFVELRPTLAVGQSQCFYTINTKISDDKIRANQTNLPKTKQNIVFIGNLADISKGTKTNFVGSPTHCEEGEWLYTSIAHADCGGFRLTYITLICSTYILKHLSVGKMCSKGIQIVSCTMIVQCNDI